ncbi:HdeD family acid-resistance protein [Aureitalea marina]|uniref:HdeD family acid-resistance protein n=1 Tax=Aureitalea marina TaxID=930804 RepID=A0A2S7KSH9_9FLAO|nr:DUF308 domain-containing protein [Aureitalea marina]PQB05584.1 hypothetical protein BST85_12260 [Aureitalea marina]
MPQTFLKRARGAVKYWYLPLLAGLVLIGIGIWTFAKPEASYAALAFLFALSFLISGAAEALFALNNRKILDGWGWTFVMGLLTLVVGLIMLNRPELSKITLAFFVGFVVLFRSFQAISVAIDLRNFRVTAWGNLMVIGVLGVIFGFILLWNPAFAGLGVIIWTGLAFLTAGIFNVILSMKLKKIHDMPAKISKELMDRYNKLEREIAEEMEKADS